MAVISIKGKQYLVEEGKTITVPHLSMEPGEQMTVKDMISGEDVAIEVLNDERGKKIRVVKFRNKTRYKRTLGYRSLNTLVKVGSIGKPAAKATPAKVDKSKAKPKTGEKVLADKPKTAEKKTNSQQTSKATGTKVKKDKE